MHQDPLRFPREAYVVRAFTVEGNPFAVRAWEGLRYCAHPADDVQRLNLYAPEAFFAGDSAQRYTAQTAPIFLPNTVGGYKPGPAAMPAVNERGEPNTVLRALMHGYVVACAGIRGRSSRTGDLYTGKLPALIVDMKAAIRYLRHNAALIPGCTERMVTSGTSAGGALSALTGASGNAADYQPCLDAIGAADARDDIFAANCYCPIINLEHADSAYEWQFCGEGSYRSWHGQRQLTPEQEEISRLLGPLFPPYVNSLRLTDTAGRALTLNADGTGPFLDFVADQVLFSAQRELDTHDSANRLPWLAVPGSDVAQQPFLRIRDGKALRLDWAGYVHAITRMKTPPAFDALDLTSTENDAFARADNHPRHFTAFSAAHSAANGQLADSGTIRLSNPMPFIGHADTAPHWRIRHGAYDRDTSLAIPVILAQTLRQHGYQVDFHLPWGLPHSGDYDLDELFAWIDAACSCR